MAIIDPTENRMSFLDRVKCSAKFTRSQDNKLTLHFLNPLPGFRKPSFGNITSYVTVTPEGDEGIYPFLAQDASDPEKWGLGNIIMNVGTAVFFDMAVEGPNAIALDTEFVFSFVNSACTSWSTGIGDSPPKALTSSSLAAGHGARAMGDTSIAVGHYAEAKIGDSIAIGQSTSASHKCVVLGSMNNMSGSYSVAIGHQLSSSVQYEFRTNNTFTLRLKWNKDEHENAFYVRRLDGWEHEAPWNVLTESTDGCVYAFIEGEAVFHYGDYRRDDYTVVQVKIGVLHPGFQPEIVHSSFTQLHRGVSGPEMTLTIEPSGLLKASTNSTGGGYPPTGSLVLHGRYHK